MPAVDWDVVVIGAGVHGAGVAQAAAAAGHSVLVLEQQTPAAGSSSRSSKLIHGGLRYLESADFGLVYESLHERELLLRLAPQLVRRSKFYLPIYTDSARHGGWIRVGLMLYSVLAGLRRGTGYQAVPRAEWQHLDGLQSQGLEQVFQYWDAQTDDAELTRAVLRSAQELGAKLYYPARFVSAQLDNDTSTVEFVVNNVSKKVRTRTLVNAAGPWAGEVAQLCTPVLPLLALDNVQGAHLELAGELQKGCYCLEVPADQRAVFAMPWREGRILFGTTEHLYHGDPAKVRVLDKEIDYLLTVYRHYFPGRSSEVLNAWAGLRVLPAAQGSAFKRSRETQLVVDRSGPPRALSIFGGKLTGYRATAQKVMAKLARSLPRRAAVVDTAKLPLHPVPVLVADKFV